ncbi:MAG: hypothetical protein FJ146_03590 [Deltaproteobacteria bacterium]|nr:hypothetical protein [Deltaproteobacteria bacterium]
MLIVAFVVVAVMLSEVRLQAVLAGAVTFALNAYAISYMAKRLLRSSQFDPLDGNSTRNTGFLILALLVKIFGLGACSYLSLIVVQLSPFYFVGGAVSVLVAFSLWRLFNYRNPRVKNAIP